MKKLLLGVALATGMNLCLAQSSGLDEAITAALGNSDRPEADVARDRNRKPLETLNFFGIRQDMRVLELLPGGGWYTRLLAPVLAENGKLYVGLGTGRVSRDLLGEMGYEEVETIATDVSFERTPERLITVGEFSFGVTDLDAVLTFRNMHNLDAVGRANMNKAVFDALKSGGIYGVVDHSRRHMEPDNPENRRRMDPVLAIKEVQDAGFVLVDFSTLHYRPDDELRFEVGRPSVTGNSDRFTLLFRKP
ncbi:MAG: hypothetical protein QNJ40_04975 [Xanthomonadales bacterium]|nr:hypothetical protein [Xanthomonadales bacterium]